MGYLSSYWADQSRLSKKLEQNAEHARERGAAYNVGALASVVVALCSLPNLKHTEGVVSLALGMAGAVFCFNRASQTIQYANHLEKQAHNRNIEASSYMMN